MKMLKLSESHLDNTKCQGSVKYICLKIPPCTANVCRNGRCYLGLTGVCFHDLANSSRTAEALLQEGSVVNSKAPLSQGPPCSWGEG